MNVRFYRNLLFEEELLEEKFIFVQVEIKAQEENLILAKRRMGLFWIMVKKGWEKLGHERKLS